jgi:hypothetical protein
VEGKGQGQGLLSYMKACVIAFCDIQNQAIFSKNLATLAKLTQEKHSSFLKKFPIFFGQ